MAEDVGHSGAEGQAESGSPSLVRMTRSTLHIGPLPPPEQIAEYERTLEGAAERIFRMAEAEQQHRHAQEQAHLAALIRDADQDRKERRLGQVFAIVIALAVLAAGTSLVMWGNVPAQIVGGLLDLTGIGSLVAIFVYGRSRERAEAEPSQQLELWDNEVAN